MTPEQRASHAQNILDNPLFQEIMDKLEHSAIERCVNALDPDTMAEGAMRVQAVRSFRSDCQSMIDSTRERKAAPA